MQQYKRLSEVEHVLTRPSMYLGNINNISRETFIVKDGKMVIDNVSHNPALVKMFDEIISNSADESIRSGSVKNIWVNITEDSISVKDDGGIPVKLHDEYGIYVPELLFGELRSGSNFNDDNRVTAGMNGLGSVLTNIFSKEFKVETCDGVNKFTQVYTDNMESKTEPEIKKQKTNGTTITFKPDLKRLKCKLDDGNISMIQKRCYDIAGIFTNVKVHFNGELIKVKSFDEFADYFVDTDKFSESNENWKVVVTSSMNDDMFRHVSYVNGIDTFEGGTHVNYIVDQLTSKIREFVKKKHKIDVKPNTIKQCLFVFIDAKINAPMFNSQTKDMLNNDAKTFDNPIELSDKFINKILKSEIIQKVLDWVEAEKRKAELAELRKVNKQSAKASLRHIIKFEDASSKEREKCMLFLCEGDSAGSSIISARGKNPYIGVFPLRGKLLNVRNAQTKKILENAEVVNMLAITGLQLGKPVDIDSLYFGKIVIATDSDMDGIHISGLLLNFFGHLWKEVLDAGIIYKLVTPIIIAKQGKNEIEFFNQDDYVTWAKENKNHTAKYYKGLGGFNNFSKFLNDEKYLYKMTISDIMDYENLDMVFNNNRADNRKEWLAQ